MSTVVKVNMRNMAEKIQFPKFWLWGELFYVLPWYMKDGLLMRVIPNMPDYSDVLGRVDEDDIWYQDPYNEVS